MLHAELFPEEAAQDQARSRISLAGALLFHAVLLLAVWPELNLWTEPERPAPERRVYVLQQTRFRPPAPPPSGGGQPAVRKPRATIPVPDLTPDLPEPWLDEPLEIDLPEIDLPIVIPSGTGNPSSSPALSQGPGGQGDSGWAEAGARYGARSVGQGIEGPVKIFSPQPLYPETAREKKLEGFVIVETIIDESGSVVEARIRKGMPHGLSEAALEAVKRWRFEPARKNGQPVAVYFVVSVAFRLQ